MEQTEVKKVNQNVSVKEIIQATYEKSLECYGIVGFARSDAQIRNDYSPLKPEKIHHGIQVMKFANGDFDVTLFVLLSAEVKLTETIFECKKIVRYFLNKKYNNHCRKVNVYAMGVR